MIDIEGDRPGPEAAPGGQMTFWEHLQELRVRLVRMIVIVAVAFLATYHYRLQLWAWAQKPFMEVYRIHLERTAATGAALTDGPFAFTDMTEPFFSLMRLSLWAAAFVSVPFLFHQVWGFIRPGLYPRERRLAIPFVVATSACFALGCAFAYFQAFRFLGDILFKEALEARLRPNLHLDTYLDLFLYTVVGTGLMFELPVLVFFLARLRILTARWLLRFWRHATIGIVAVSAVITPGDIVVTTIFFSLVLMGLYFVSILVAFLAAPRARPAE